MRQMTYEEQARQLVENSGISRILEENRRNCAAIDAHYERFYSNKANHIQNATPPLSPTMHDLAQRNPHLRKMLRELQAIGIPREPTIYDAH
jgi:hypothetical protein